MHIHKGQKGTRNEDIKNYNLFLASLLSVQQHNTAFPYVLPCSTNKGSSTLLKAPNFFLKPCNSFPL